MEKFLSREYIPGIDGIRAIAVLAVIIFHMNVIPIFQGGFTGVDVFFVISGYVISKTLANNPSKTLGGYILEFYKRRLTRIVPALIVMLLATVIASTLFIPSSWLSNSIDSTGLSAFFGYSNFSLIWNNDGYFSPKVELNPFLHTWSLAVEEQFYLIYPIIFFFILKMNVKLSIKNNNKIINYQPFFLLVFLTGASLIFSFFESSKQGMNAYFLLPSRFWELAAGALLFEQHSQGRFVPRKKGWMNLLILAGFVSVVTGFFLAEEHPFPFPWAFFPVAGTLLLISGSIKGREDSSFFQKKLSFYALTYIGKISYSLYLWHWPIAVLFRWTFGFETLFSKVLYVLVTFVLAIFSYHVVENPIRRGRFIQNWKSWKVITTSLISVVLAYFFAWFVVNEKPQLSLSVTKNSYIWQSGYYDNDGPDKPITRDKKVLGRQIFAVGDSHTAAYRTMLNIVSKELGVKVYEYEEGDCPVAGLLKPMDEKTKKHFEYALNEIKKLMKPGDVVFLASLRMPECSDQFDPVDVDEVVEEFLSKKSADNRKQALEEANKVIKDFIDCGASVVMEAPLPLLSAPPYRCSDWFNKMNPVGANGLSIKRDILEKMRRPVLDSIATLKKNNGNFYVWDPFPILCTKDTFSAFDYKGNPIFWDGDHLSGNGNRILAPSFREFLVSVWCKKNE